MKKYFIVSDTHSFYNILRESLDNKGFDIDNKEHYLIICGDLFDRGLESKEILEFVQSLEDRFIYVKGNHEDLLEDCMFQLGTYGYIRDNHHYSNGTVRTIANLCDVSEYDFQIPGLVNIENTYKIMKPILNWISDKAINYFEVGDYIFVHGWIPCKCADSNVYHARKYVEFDPDWNKAPIITDDLSPETTAQICKYNYKWDEARWLNGMDCWKQGVKIPGKTIVCGHWHSSWGHSHLNQDRKEWPEKNRKDWKRSFEPFIKEGIIAIDGCVAYSEILNCIVLDEQEDGKYTLEV